MRIIHIGDLHFGIKKFSTKFIIDNLEKHFLSYLKSEDIIFIAGDVFDTSISLNNIDSHYTIGFFLKLFQLAEELNILIRIVRGTFSHDRNQISILSTLYDDYKFTFNFKYINKLELEYIKKYDIKLAYIPDDLPFKSSIEVVQTLKKRLADMNWKNVDYILGHGSFTHVFPPNLFNYPKITFEIDQFKDIVTKRILFGHIHIPSIRDKVIYCGSFDRLRHNEHGKKGFFIIEDHKDITFIENKSSMIFKDFVWKKNFNDNMQPLEEYILKHYKRRIGFIRLINIPTELKESINHFFNSRFPEIKYDFFKNKTKHIDIKNDLFKINDNLVAPNKENISNIIRGFIEKRYNHSLDLEVIKSVFGKI